MWRGTWYEAKHEPIYSADEWARLQASFGVPTTHRSNLKYDGLFAQGPLSLRCANDSCKCKITYAPKVKPKSGIEYKYYRCADGKRIHKNDGHSQINVREADILAQLGTALDQVTLTADIAEAIAQGLNETHQAAKAAKTRLVKTYGAELSALKQKEDRLFDHFDSGEIDRATYDRQLTRLRAEQHDCFEKLQQAQNNEDEKYLVSAERVLELAKRAKSLWEGRQPTEKRDLLERLVCNPRLDGRTVRYDLRKPFDVISKMRGVEGWRPQRDSNGLQNTNPAENKPLGESDASTESDLSVRNHVAQSVGKTGVGNSCTLRLSPAVAARAADAAIGVYLRIAADGLAESLSA